MLEPRTAPRTVALVAYVALVGALALAGALLVVVEPAIEQSLPAGPPSLPALGEPMATGFGSVTLEHVEILDGLTAEDLGGMTHGVQGLVLADKAQVQLSFLLENTSERPVWVAPSQFHLNAEDSAAPGVLAGSTIQPTWLRSGASLKASLIFVVPRSAGALAVEYTAPGSPGITAPAGEVDDAPAPPPAEGGHSH